ncbi:Protein translocase subunit SecY [Geodia barretti]|nr:Protein translocase subunit SecY [Geodia barretti]
MGVYPYITASIILQVLTPVIPQLRELSREGGEAGRRTLNRYTHYLTVPLAILQGWALLNTLELQGAITGIGLGGGEWMNTTTIILCMTATTMLLVWMGEIVTEKGIGNGISLIIFAGIVASLPQTAGQMWALRDQAFQVTMLVAMMLIIIFVVVIFNEAQRRVPVQYGRSVFRGGQMYRQTGASFIPLRVNAAGMIPLIFAFSIVTLPATIAHLPRGPEQQQLHSSGCKLGHANADIHERPLLGVDICIDRRLHLFLCTGCAQPTEPRRKSSAERRFRARHSTWTTDAGILDAHCVANHVGGRDLPRRYRYHSMDSQSDH